MGLLGKRSKREMEWGAEVEFCILVNYVVICMRNGVYNVFFMLFASKQHIQWNALKSKKVYIW